MGLKGELAYNWKGDSVGYGSLHEWVRSHKPEPELCERCHLVPPRDLANKNGNYTRDINEWEYLCRKCHMNSDGRMEQIKQLGHKRKLPSKICFGCHQSYHRGYGMRVSKYCSPECYRKSRIGITRKFYGNQHTKAK